MARKTRRRISYVLPLVSSAGGHRLGVNGLAIDTERSILYSAGRDGLICAWDLNVNLKCTSSDSKTPPSSSPNDSSSGISFRRPSSTTFRKQDQAHTHWVNDIILTQSNLALVSASSDTTVKVWRPHSENDQIPKTIGLHSDYVKCLASPGVHSDWVASGGLDHKIKIWDLNGGGEKLQIDIGEHENSVKGSVYALSVQGSIMASGGPDSIVRLWDPKSGKRITNFVGHTDNVRDILISEDSDRVMTASSDQTVKVWSITAGRCMHTLSMHTDSVWSLYSDHPQLSVFYSSDRSGMVAKTSVRHTSDMDEGLSLAIAQEHDGVNKVIVSGNYIWTATSSSSINRWADVDTDNGVQAPEAYVHKRVSSVGSRSIMSASPSRSDPAMPCATDRLKIPLTCVLSVSNNAMLSVQKFRDPESSTTYSGAGPRKTSEAITDQDLGIVLPYHSLPQETIEGQNGLLKHVMLNDRRRVLTLDTAGEVLMWDLLMCAPPRHFGKRYLEDVIPEVNTAESVSNWCAVDTRTGRLACVLEENYCFDAETYADELNLDIKWETERKEDQRINLGKWILRYLFDNLVEEELKRDSLYRRELANLEKQNSSLIRENAPPLIQLPSSNLPNGGVYDDTKTFSRNTNGITPGLSIGIATPHPATTSHSMQAPYNLASMAEEGTILEKRQSHQTNPRTSTETQVPVDYFSNKPQRYSTDNLKPPLTPVEPPPEAPLQSPGDVEKEEKAKEGTSFLSKKKFRMNFPKKLGRSSTETKAPVLDGKAEESEKLEGKEDKVREDNFLGLIQKIRLEYEEQLQQYPHRMIESGIRPSTPGEMPILRPSPSTTIIIQEDHPDSGGVADLYRGTVGSSGLDADLIEKTAPMWLGDLLLRNSAPQKDSPKVSFVLHPYKDRLPSIASAEGNSRLNANRMLRAKKIMAYVAKRIEPRPGGMLLDDEENTDAMKPEEYLELWCQNTLVKPTVTLATLRAHIWKNGGDVVIYYKSNGKRPELEKRMTRRDGDETPPRLSEEG